MKIVDIRSHVLSVPDLKPDATSSSQDDIVVEVVTDEGIVGIGETDVGPWIAKAVIESPSSHSMALGLRELLLGCDPLDTTALWEKMYVGTCMNGRRGAGICAIGAIDMALWDIKGKALGLPIYKLLGGAHHDSVIPYASLQPDGASISEYGRSLVEWLLRAREFGFGAAKLECTLSGPYAHQGLQGSDEQMTEILTECRNAVGGDFVLMVDVQYRWADAKSALRILKRWEELDFYFVETPLSVDNLEGYATLSRESPMRIASGEWLTTRFEFADAMDYGHIDVAQPDVGRAGGLTEAMRICEMAQDRGKLIVPHCWKSAIGIAASLHMAAAVPHCPYIEFLPSSLSDSPLRRELTIDDIPMKGDEIPRPGRPGLGVELNPEALEKYSVQ